ncbi:MAG: dipeptidase [Dethiobacter sp.]|mgnify:CR=1 FL=1|nr:dipeptidase [Dethiobacter sp.]MBS3983423.1 dipeptidase [Dethiobacter sp.]MCL4463363.1 dipeptidase [Bacillota bacterium]MCL5992563.1 dipeptidase [Bacillota bacterium]
MSDSLSAEDLHRQAVVVDAHCDTVQLFNGINKSYHFGQRNQVGHLDLPRLREGGVKIQFFALFLEPEYKACAALERTLTLMEHFLYEMGKHPESVAVIQSWPDLAAALAKDKLGAILALEGAEALANVEILHILYRLGLRSVGLTWNARNMLADGVGAGRNPGGLTELGREMVREMNRLGILVDAAHLAPRGFYDLLTETSLPIIVTHANAAGVCSHKRNLSDEQLRLLRDNDGVVGLTYYPPFVAHSATCGIEELLDHFCYIADRFGINILGLGSDYDGISTVVNGLNDVSRLPRLTEALLQRGFSPEEVKQILGENFLRVIKTTLEQGGR